MEIEVGKDYVFQPFDFERRKKATVRAVGLTWSLTSFAQSRGLRHDGVQVVISRKVILVNPATLVAPWTPPKKAKKP